MGDPIARNPLPWEQPSADLPATLRPPSQRNGGPAESRRGRTSLSGDQQHARAAARAHPSGSCSSG
jgi:hypothetical protein